MDRLCKGRDITGFPSLKKSSSIYTDFDFFFFTLYCVIGGYGFGNFGWWGVVLFSSYESSRCVVGFGGREEGKGVD